MTIKFDLSQALAMLQEARHICVMSHINPDGDAVGSLLGLTSALRANGKKASPSMSEAIPTIFAFLPGIQNVIHEIPEDADLFITVDCADMARLGNIAARLPGKTHINIDHHISNTNYAQINLVDTQVPSTAEHLMRLLVPFGMKMDQDVATCLLTGILTDTLGFRTVNTTPDTLAAAKSLMESGAPMHQIYQRTLHQRSLSATRLWGHALAEVQCSDGLAWASVPLSAKAHVGYTASGDANIVTQLTAIEMTDVAVVFVERSHDEVKISWRSNTGLDVASLAKDFGGGGHHAASGANLYDTTLADAQREVLSRTRSALQRFRKNGRKDGID